MKPSGRVRSALSVVNTLLSLPKLCGGPSSDQGVATVLDPGRSSCSEQIFSGLVVDSYFLPCDSGEGQDSEPIGFSLSLVFLSCVLQVSGFQVS